MESAWREGKTVHSIILEANTEKTDEEESANDFRATAEKISAARAPTGRPTLINRRCRARRVRERP